MGVYFKQARPENFRAGRKSPVEYLVLHYTANQGDTARGNLDFFAREVTRTSAHYFVDRNEVCQSVPEGAAAYHVGGKTRKHPRCVNDNSIGVELCDSAFRVPRETEQRALELARDIIRRYHIPPENVLRHYDVTGKLCPLPWVRDPAGWWAFKKELEEVDDMTEEQVRQIVRNELEAAEARRAKESASAWAKDGLEQAKAAGITDGTRPHSFATREEVALMVNKRFLEVR